MGTLPDKFSRLKYYSLLLLFCMAYWVGDSIWSYLSFERNLHTLMYIEPASLLDTLFLRVSPYQMVSRIIVVTLFALAGTILFEILTVKNRVEKAFRDSEEKYRVVVNNASEAIYVVQNRRVKFVNPKACELMGMVTEELIDQHIEQFIHPDDQADMRHFIVQQFRPDGPRKCAFRMTVKNRQIIWVRLNTTPITWKGEPAFLNFLNDISEEKALSDQLQRSEKMETLGLLAGGVAHDLNNILSGLVSYPDILLVDLPENSPLRDSILEIQKSGQKASLIVQDLLTLSRRNVPGMKVIRMNSLIREYFVSPEFAGLSVLNPGVSFKTDLDPDLMNIQGSWVHLSKVLMNLVTNAAEACLSGGTVIISTCNQYLSRTLEGYEKIKSGHYVVLTVTDSGEGMGSEDIQHVFEPFYSKKVLGHSGTGLGMAVVWGSVKDHKGYIDIHSRPGRGTQVSIFFPVTWKEPVQITEQSVPELRGNGQKILVVDDVEAQRMIASEVLSRLGYQPHVVASGEEAVAYMRIHTADLVILDMIMDKGMDGLETYKAIIAIHPGQKTIIISGFSETDRVREMQRLGAGQYLKKPYTMVNIGKVIKSTLAQ